MNQILRKYTGPETGCDTPYNPGLVKRLQDEKARLTQRLDLVTAALNALEEQPKTAELLETIMKVI